ALEEALVDGVEEVLFVGELGHGAGGVFDGDVEAVEGFEEIAAVESAPGQGVDDFFDLGGDDIAAVKVGVAKDFADEALGEQVLDEHLIDGGDGDVGVEGG